MMPMSSTIRRGACGAILLGLLCAHPAAALVCGDGVLDPFETCDDGNLVPGDGCTPLCQLENVPPICTGASASVTDLWPPNHKLATVLVTGVVDPDDDPVAIVVTAIAQDEPVDGSGDGDSCPDAEGVGTDAAQVRVERSGEGDGRVYHIAFAAADGRGGTCIGSVTTCVPHDRGRGSVCADGGPLFDSTGADPATCGGCDLRECVPPDDELDDCAADLPRGIERRTARARALLARAADVGPGPRATRLARRATRVLARAAERARAALEGICGDAVGSLLDAAGHCAECPGQPSD
jgi:cysteine-rich repeat protein